VRVDLLVTDRPITPSGTGRAAPRHSWSEVPTDGVWFQSSNHVIRSQVETPVLPKLQRTSHSAVDPHGSSTTSLVFEDRCLTVSRQSDERKSFHRKWRL
jgi:hypothetical protein